MAVFDGSIYSEVMQMQTGITVIFPEGTAVKPLKDGTFPVLYLLHGLEDDHTCWLRRSRIDSYVRDKSLVVVMPEVQRSFYTDMAQGLPYYTYLTEDLPRMMKQMFRVTDDPRHTYIAGLSMGGYGALKCAFRNPGAYAAVGSFSGAADLRLEVEDPAHSPFFPGEAHGIFGDRLSSENDLLMLTAKSAKEHAPVPPLYITCGLSDPLYDANKRLRTQMDFLKIPYAYEEWAGAHNWDFWDVSIQNFLKFILPES